MMGLAFYLLKGNADWFIVHPYISMNNINTNCTRIPNILIGWRTINEAKNLHKNRKHHSPHAEKRKEKRYMSSE